jgi:hypothetical protein
LTTRVHISTPTDDKEKQLETEKHLKWIASLSKGTVLLYTDGSRSIIGDVSAGWEAFTHRILGYCGYLKVTAVGILSLSKEIHWIGIRCEDKEEQYCRMGANPLCLFSIYAVPKAPL